MDSGFYSSFAAFAARSDALEVIGNNIANANTVGFKSQHSFYRSFAGWAAPSTPMRQAINSFSVSGNANGTTRSAPTSDSKMD